MKRTILKSFLTCLLALALIFSVVSPASANQYLRYSTDNRYQVQSKLDLSNLKVRQSMVVSTDNSNSIQINDDTSSNIQSPKLHCNDSSPGMSFSKRISSGNPDYQFELRYNNTPLDCRAGAYPFYRSNIRGNQNMNIAPMQLLLFKVADSGNTTPLRYPDFQMCKREGSTSDSDRGCWRGENNGLSRYYPSSPRATITVKPPIQNTSLTKAFSPNTIDKGETSTLTLTISENSINDRQDNQVSFTDTLENGLVIATPANIQNTCTGGTITANEGDTTLSVVNTVLSNGTPNCSVSVDVTAASQGSYINGASDISGLALIETNTMTDQTLTVVEPCDPNKPIPGAFSSIRIGDFDGFGFGDGEGLTAPYGGPVNRDGSGLLSTQDFLPDFNGDGKYSNRDGGDPFDNRSGEEVAGTFLTGDGYEDTGSTGSDYTDLFLGKAFANKSSSTYGNSFPDGDPKTLPNTPGFKFRFKVAKDKLPEGTPLFLNVVLGDFDVEPVQVILNSGDGNTVTKEVTASAKGKKDGMIQTSYLSLEFDQVFTDGDANGEAGYWLGYLDVDFDAPDEPTLAFDFAEIATKEIPLTPCPKS